MVLRIFAWTTVWVLFWTTGVETFIPSLIFLMALHLVATGFDFAAIIREKKRIERTMNKATKAYNG